MTAGWSGLELGIAALALNRLWRDRGAGEETSGWRARWREVLHGNRESRQRLGREWLDINPFVWLAGRDRRCSAG
jgi:hypothetical protein